MVREPDANDRRRVIVRVAADEPTNRVGPFYRSIKRRLEAVYDTYTEKELALLVQFYERAVNALRDETIALRSESEPPR